MRFIYIVEVEQEDVVSLLSAVPGGAATNITGSELARDYESMRDAAEAEEEEAAA